MLIKPAPLPSYQATNSPKQFNFGRNWRKRIAPLLDKLCVVRALELGMSLTEKLYQPGCPPYIHGGIWAEGPISPKKGTLPWYQPWRRCHAIAPFSWAIGKELFPELKWGFLSSRVHTVAIGYRDQWEEPEWVMDILLFRLKSAQESLEFVRSSPWSYFPSLDHYAASFPAYRKAALKRLEKMRA
ncbi:MAG TPA: hypothetical protein VGM05_21405 [Planctomycetaceae bacterium]